MGRALVQRQGGSPVGDTPLCDGGGLEVAEVPALLTQVQQVPEKYIFLTGGLALTDGGLHFRDLLFQGLIFRFQGGDVLIVILLVGKPAGYGGADCPERTGNGVGQIHQRGGVGAEIGQQSQRHGDHRPGEEDP